MTSTFVKMLKRKSRKGITPVIAVILLLLMTVAAAGAAFLWITKFQGLVSAQMNNQLTNQQRCQGILLTIDNIWNDEYGISFVMRNAGSVNLKVAELNKTTVTGGVSGKPVIFTNGISIGYWSANTTCGMDSPPPSPYTWNVGESYKVTCNEDPFVDDSDVADNDVYAITITPPCGNGAVNSFTYDKSKES